jgi:hypothetical protein
MPSQAGLRLLRLELRRNVMVWLIPVAVGLFWYDCYRATIAMPAMWNLRAMNMQSSLLLDFVPPVVGAAAWMGSRDARRKLTDLTGVTAHPRWTRQLTTWAATTALAMIAYVGCVAAVYIVTAVQARSGGPLWWPAIVGAAGIPAIAAIGFALGAAWPSRFTAPLAVVLVFFGLGVSAQFAHGSQSYFQISPGLSGANDLGPDSGLATFFHYLPDLSIAQVMFLAGLTAVALGAIGLPAGSGGRRLRRSAAILAACGLAASATAVTLAGTARLDQHGMISIPALHDAANDRPIRYTPVCSATAIPVCLNPAYAAYLPQVAAALAPALSELAGLPGAPARIDQAAPTYIQGQGNLVSINGGLMVDHGAGGARTIDLVLPDLLPGEPGSPPDTDADFIASVNQAAAPIIDSVILATRPPAPGRPVPARSLADQAVAQGLVFAARTPALALIRRRANLILDGPLTPGVSPSGPSQEPAAELAAARRFASLPAATRHSWLRTHLTALRAGRITLAQLP